MFNLPAMKNIILTMILIAAGNGLFAQHIHYSDKAKRIKTVALPNQPIPAAKAEKDTVVYHKWPDLCPGLSGSIPALTNYVPGEIVLKLTEFYKGHLYSITSLIIGKDKLEYKLKVCDKGEITLAYADASGDIITK